MAINKKVGVLTFHHKDNFGALLQCYALQTYLNSIGYSVEIINYKPKTNFLLLTLRLIKSHVSYVYDNFNFKYIGIYFIQFFSLFKQTLKFNYFRNSHLNISEIYYTNISDHNLNKYDYIITGSDQIWNSIQGYYNAYFLIPFTKYVGKRLSYAACRGIKHVDEKDVSSLKEALENYDWIGVRDKQTKEFVEKNSDKIADIVCDPSMLIDYSKLISTNSPVNFKYIFVYILGKEISGGHLRTIKSIKSSIGKVKVVACYLTRKNPNYFSWADIHLYDSSPIDWINFIKHSDFVYTDSFHGLLFATKFKKRVLAFYAEKNRASRLIDIAERLEISNCIVSSYDEAIKKNSFKSSLDDSNYKILSDKFINNSKLKLTENLKN